MTHVEKIALTAISFFIAIMAITACPGKARAADNSFPDLMIVEANLGQQVSDYETFPRGKKPDHVFFKKVRHRIMSGRAAYDEMPELFERRLIAAATFCVRYQSLPNPTDFIGTTNRTDEFTWLYNPNYWGDDGKYVMTAGIIDAQRDRILDACKEVRRFGRRNRGWDAFPDSVRIPVTIAGFEGFYTLISGIEASQRPDYDQLLRKEDSWCNGTVLSGARPGRVGVPPSNSDYILTLQYAPEFSLSGRDSVPYRFNLDLAIEEYKRCEDVVKWLRRRGR